MKSFEERMKNGCSAIGNLRLAQEADAMLADKEREIKELKNELYLCANLSGSVRWSEELLKYDKLVIRKMLKEVVPCCLEEIEEYIKQLKRNEAWTEKS